MEQMITTPEEMSEYLLGELKRASTRNQNEIYCYVTSKIRRDWMVSFNQNKITLDGWIYNLWWGNMQGGVWKVSVDLMERI